LRYLAVFFAFIAAPLSSLHAGTAVRPNILYLYVDDMGWGSIGPNGQDARRAAGKPWVKTPNLDRLAAEGINFSRAYGATVCSPARSSQQTGFHQGHTFTDRNDSNGARKAMRKDDVLMGDVLSDAGYVTGYWGKWGFGGSSSLQDPVIENVQSLPTSHGYTYVLAELHHVRAHTYFQPTLWSAPAPAGAKGGLELIPNSMQPYASNPAYPEFPSRHNQPGYPTPAYCDDSYAFAALDFVRAQAANFNRTGQPFFGLLAVQIPHAPFGEITTLPEWNAAYADAPQFATLSAQSQQWAAMVTRIDAHFGHLLAALDDPNGDGDTSDSVTDDTLVIFQSDNGGPGDRSCREYDANGGLRGYKGSIYEGGIRIPTVMRWPARITGTSGLKAGTDSDMVIDVSDLLPTFCELAGVLPPVGLDGVSLAPTLLGAGHQRARAYLIHEAANKASIIHGRHKLVMGRSGKMTGKAGLKAPHALYDLSADPAETRNIAAAHPQLVRELAALLEGERVGEPAGFANTYHRWTGADGADIADPDNWSDYIYANAGKTYLRDTGAPRVSWTAFMHNTGDTPRTARAGTDVSFLGLEIGGPAAPGLEQTLVVPEGARVTGRNEIRLAGHGVLALEGGSVASLRWVDVLDGGCVRGSGLVDTTLYNAGTVTATGTLGVTGSYREQPGARCEIVLGKGVAGRLRVDHDAHLAGTLSVSVEKGFEPADDGPIMVVTADHIAGSFANKDDQVVAGDGRRFAINYSAGAVTLAALPKESEER
jgi:arylsulfatase A-like enzyme